MALTKRLATPAMARRKKAMQRIRKQAKRKTEKNKPSWQGALKKSYTSDMQKRREKLVAAEKEKKSKKNMAMKRGRGEEEEAAEEGAEEEEGLGRFDDELLRDGEGGGEVQGEVDEDKMKRMNERNPLETQLFLKNMPVDITEEELIQTMGRYGDIRKVFLVRNRVTKMPTGTGFVHCGSLALVDQIINLATQNARELSAADRQDMAGKTEGMTHHQAKKLMFKLRNDTFEARDPFLTIRNSRVSVFRVLSRTDSQEVTAAMQKKKKRTKVAGDDPRNLYLLQEGFIDPEGPAARDLPRNHINFLLRDYEGRKQQLRNSNFFISKTRLNIRHLPKKVTEVELRKLCSGYARKYLKKNPDDLEKEDWGKFGPIKNTKLLKDSNGMSRGYGFVEFANHNVALAVLRQLNNNPEVYGPTNRPVVSFAVESMNAVQKLARIRDLKKQRRIEGYDENAAVGYEQ